MDFSNFWRRAGFASVPLLIFVASCDSVLGIEEPRERETEGAGAPATAGTATGGDKATLTPAGGAGGEAGGATTGGGGHGGNGGAGGDGGDAGAGRSPSCDPDQRRCGGDAEKTPELCDDNGEWAPNPEENGGEACPLHCSDGRCVECLAEQAPRCTTCQDGDVQCNPRQPQHCVDGAWETEGPPCAHHCDAGACVIPPSCNGAGMRGICNDESCCRSLLVPGGTFNRDYDGGEYFSDAAYPATVTSFYLDKYEVTVGRMRAFVDAFELINLQPGQGKAAHVQGDTGWQSSLSLPASKEALVQTLGCAGGTWSSDIGVNDQRPIGCVPFNVAYAFCVWDGGRLPTSTEWNYAAAGGDEQRVYPWGSEIDATRAAYGGTQTLPPEVGSTPGGAALWGHQDMAGSVAEWTLDYYEETHSMPVCNDCLNTTASAWRVVRGSDFLSIPEVLVVARRLEMPPAEVLPELGFRCARDLK